MTFPIALLKSSTHNACEYDSLDSDDTTIPGSRIAFALTDARSHCLPQLSDVNSSSTTATRTPLPSRWYHLFVSHTDGHLLIPTTSLHLRCCGVLLEICKF